MSEHTYVTYSEVFGVKPTEEDLLALLKTVRKNSAFARLSRVNNLLGLFPISLDEAKFIYIQSVLCRSLLSQESYRTLEGFVKDISLVERPIFHRQQVLLLMKLLLLEGSDAPDREQLSDETETKTLGELLFMLSEFLVTEEQDMQTASDSPLEPSESERVMNGLMGQLIPSMELMNSAELTASLVRTKHYIQLFDTEYPQLFNKVSLSSFFESATGISPANFLQMVIEVYATYIQHEPDDLIRAPEKFNLLKSGYFSNLTHSDESVRSFYELTTSSFNGLNIAMQESPLNSTLLRQYDFTVFRTFPLFHLSDDVVTPIDIDFLLEKVSSGFYYTVLNSLRTANIDPQPFFKAWGEMFEKYVSGIFRGIYPEIANRFHPNLFFDSKTEMEAFDGTIEYPNSLIAMEYKGGLLNSRARYGGDISLLLEEMGKRFGRSKDAAIGQLATKIELLFHSDNSKRKRIQSLDFGHIKRVFPVLVANELNLRFGLTHFRLRNWFEEEMATRNIDASVSVGPLMVLTVDDLERLQPYLEAGDFSLLDFMEYYSQTEYKRFAGTGHWYEPLTSLMEVFYRFRRERDIAHRPNPSIQAEWGSFMDGIMGAFKPEVLGQGREN